MNDSIGSPMPSSFLASKSHYLDLGFAPKNRPPIKLLPGERIAKKVVDTVAVWHQNAWLEGEMWLTNFQLVIKVALGREILAPLMCVESIKKKTMAPDHYQLKIKFKDFRQLRLTYLGKGFDDMYGYLCQWQGIDSIQALFAFSFRFAVSPHLNGWLIYDAVAEYERMGIPNSSWRITNINAEYLLCSTYPQKLVVPAKVTGQELMKASKFRSGGRMPVLVWKHPARSVVICRSSQPLSGLTGHRCVEDEKLISTIAQMSDARKVVVMDARPKANAVANQMTGGGYENTVHYESTELHFAHIPNIHAMYDSWYRMSTLINSNIDESRWLSALEATQWMSHIQNILNNVVYMVSLIEQGVSILIHCSDGWDRTPTLHALAELLLDPYYRTINGFIVLIEKDWLSFGHRFGDRCNHRAKGTLDENSLKSGSTVFSPIFMLFVDAVYQVLRQFPFAFEFNSHMLKCMMDACYSCQYGTFLCNAESERQTLRKHTVSFWTLINSNKTPYLNPLYRPTAETLHPTTAMKDLVFWDEFYMRGWPGFPQQHPRIFPHRRFMEEVIVMLTERDTRIKELERELAVLKPDMFPSESVVKPIVDQLIDDVLKICFSHVDDEPEREEPPNQQLLLMKRRSVSFAPVARDLESLTKHHHSHLHLQHLYTHLNGEMKRSSSMDLAVAKEGKYATTNGHGSRLPKKYTAQKWPTSLYASDTNLPHPEQQQEQPDDADMLSELQQQQQQQAALASSDRSFFSTPTRRASLPDTSHPTHNQSHSSSHSHSHSHSHAPLTPTHTHGVSTFAPPSFDDNDNDNHNPHAVSLPVFPSPPSHRRSTKGRNSLLLKRPPTWVPDHQAVKCRLCRTEFNFFRRKHHCRNCGQIFCASCCCHKRPIPSYGITDPVQVCHQCLSVLEEESKLQQRVAAGSFIITPSPPPAPLAQSSPPGSPFDAVISSQQQQQQQPLS